MQLQVIQIRIKVFLLKDIPLNQTATKVTAFLDKGFAKDPDLLARHEDRGFKWYCNDFFYPPEKDGVYRKGKIYTITVRTADLKMANYFQKVCVDTITDEIKGLTSEIQIIPQKPIQAIWTVTPVIVKTEEGYWRGHMSLQQFEERLKVNLIKKWNAFPGNDKMEEDFQLYDLLEFINQKPVPFNYKQICLLGDKIRLHISDNERAQKLAYFSLFAGVGECNSRGAGFVNYQWY